MARRMAAALALVVFAVCVIAGLGAGNSFETVLTKALAAMAATFVDENLAAETAKAAGAEAGRPAAKGEATGGKN